jgi:hypothetical protein
MKPASTQTDRNLNFDGIGDGPKKGSSKYAHNAWSGHSNDGRTVNMGRGSTVGNDGSCHPVKNAGGNPTKSPYVHPPVSSVKPVPKQGSVRDNINRGSQYRGVGGTTVKQPANPDQIRAKQSGGPDYGAVSKGSKPNTAAGRTDFNYGPKSQY